MKYGLLKNDQGKIVTNLAWEISHKLFTNPFGFPRASIFVTPGTGWWCPFEENLYVELQRQLWDEPLNQTRMFEQLPEAVGR